jgi:hypothetical protein
MKRALLMPLGLIALLSVAFASAAPATFVFNTSGFNFTDLTLTTGYIGFAMNGHQLQVNLASGAPVSSLPSITLALPGSTTNADGATVYPTLANLADVSTTSNGGQTTGFTVTHGSASLGNVVADYVKSLDALGFKSTPDASNSSDLAVYTFTMNGMQLRAVFHQMGANVTAHLTGSTAA